MSYSYIGTFVDVKNKKRISSGVLNRLKSLNMHSYHCDLRDISPTGTAKDEDFPEITNDVYFEYIAYFKKELLDEFTLCPYRKKEWNKTQNAYFVNEDVYNKLKSKFAPYEIKISLEDYKSFDENSTDIVILYEKRVRKNNGKWYRREDFEKAEEKLAKAYIDKTIELHELKKLKNTKDWFEMSDEAKSSYFQEVSDLEDAINDDYRPEFDAIEYILNLFEYLQEDMGTPKYNEFGELSYEWNYDDGREIELYIEVD